jgi:hypothetical protein
MEMWQRHWNVSNWRKYLTAGGTEETWGQRNLGTKKPGDKETWGQETWGQKPETWGNLGTDGTFSDSGG